MGLINVVENTRRPPATRVPNMPAQPPPPLIGPTGSVGLDAVADVVNRTVAPFRSAPDPKQGVCGAILHYVGGALGVIGAPFEMLDTGFAMVTAPLAALMPGMPAAVLGMPHLGPPHAHLHPPSWIPPAPPVPLPSFGMIMLPGCVSVLVGGLPAARAGDMGLAITCGSFSPAFDIFTGSSNTWIGGSRAARIFDITRHCNPLSAAHAFSKAMMGVSAAMNLVGAGAQASAGNALAARMAAAQAAADAGGIALAALLGKDPGVPPGYGVVLLGNPLVLIGGFPMPDLMEVITGLLKGVSRGLARLRQLQRSSRTMRRLSNALRSRASRAMRRLGINRNTRKRVARAICFVTGHPVDVVSGNVFTTATDFVLPGPLPQVFEREWHSHEAYDGNLGHGWHHSFDLAICELDDAVALRLADGRSVAFPALELGDAHFDRQERITLLRDRQGYALRMGGLLWRFGEATGEVQPLRAVGDSAGLGLSLSWTRLANGRHALVELIDSGGRRYRVGHDALGRMTEVEGPAPDGGSRTLVRYVYDVHGNLCEVYDALGQVTRYGYSGQLMVRETDRRGLSFHFAYEADAPGARCVRTWGDGGIYDHHLSYDDEAGTTVVRNSLGEETRYQRGDNGLPTAVLDARGETWSMVYNDFAQTVVQTDPLGRSTITSYDERGNVSKVVTPEGGTLEVGWREDRPVCAVDARGGWWQWHYDEHGRTVGRDEPDGSRYRWRYQGAYLQGLEGPAGETVLGYDRAGNLDALREPDGAVYRWRFDAIARPIEEVDASGGVTRRSYDALDRVVERVAADGQRRTIAWDPLGKPRTIRDGEREYSLGWWGLGKLAWVEERGARERREYDSEGRLLALVDAGGRRHAFERDALGEIVAEIDVDGRRREYRRDAVGDVSSVLLPGGEEDRYERDAAGRVLRRIEADGADTRFGYGVGGDLLAAEREGCSIYWRRDAVGRVVEERQLFGDEEHWIRSRYDGAGRRVAVSSSLGADIDYGYDDVGRPRSLAARAGEASFVARITRDELGREIDRALPGNLHSRWAYDPLGRPLEHTVFSEHTAREQRRYRWEGDQLRQLLVHGSAGEQTFDYGHDSKGGLAWARYGDGEVELRAADRYRNLFRRRERDDRRYAGDGRLLVSSSHAGIIRYEWDERGRMVARRTPTGRWRYEWNARDELLAVVRPDGGRVEFVYDPVGRRVAKRYRGKLTRWLWDGEQPLHEWTALDQVAPQSPAVPDLAAALGVVPPPLERAPASPSTGPPKPLPGVITWVFDTGGGQLAARLCDGQVHSLICDHLGTPLAVYDGEGRQVSAQELSIYGALRSTSGNVDLCPFSWPGQYRDVETGLAYNRFRYYDPEAGCYISSDPLGAGGGVTSYGYVVDPLRAIDPLGLRDIIIIGENQFERVIPTRNRFRKFGARDVASEWPADRQYTRRQADGTMFPDDFDDSIAFNREWIKDRISEGAIVIDVGRDPARVAAGQPISPWYQMELDELRRAGYTTMFDNLSGWKPPGSDKVIKLPRGVTGRLIVPPRQTPQQGCDS